MLKHSGIRRVTTKEVTKSTKFRTINFRTFVVFAVSFENTCRKGLSHFKQNPSIASFQHGVLESS
jgi:hypothetical protein